MRMAGRVLIVDDDQAMCELIAHGLRAQGIECRWFTSPEEAYLALKSNGFDVVLTDLNMPGMSGTELCRQVVASFPDTLVIVITAFGSMETAVAAIRAGAYDFITKPVELGVLTLTVDRALRHHALQDKVKILSQEVAHSRGCDEMLGESPLMRDSYSLIERFAQTDAPVLITGESGTGKELAARILHRHGRRRARPFVAVNCAALPETLLESELFGHKRGAFTDAHLSRKGLLVQADGGTLFLDEIGDIPLSVQPKLLRALEEGTVRPVGGDEELRVDVRLISATSRDLETAVEEGRFREELYYRIHVLHLELPPLRARGTDTLLLAQRFVEQFAGKTNRPVTGISHPAAQKLLAYAWPGNVRELRNAIERAVALAQYPQITVEDLPPRVSAYEPQHVVVNGGDPQELLPMEAVEKRYILHVLQAMGGNRTLAARVLGLGRRTLHRKLQSYEQDRTSGGQAPPSGPPSERG
jgi:two-component system response regulator AtoC